MTREEELVANLRKWSYDYYETGEVSVDDETFNACEDELRILNPNHPILSIPGYGYEFSGVDEALKFEHPIPVGSIPKIKNMDELIAELGEDIDDCTVSTKIDGNSLVHYYKTGRYWKSVTRGRYNIGIDRTAKFIDKVPAEIPLPYGRTEHLEYSAVRGEAAIPKCDYTVENGFDVEKSSRNAVAGAISRQDDWEPVMKFVKFVAYTFIDVETGANLYDTADWASVFEVETQKKFTLEEIKNLPAFKLAIKDSYAYEADGAVFRKPNGQLFAFKFEDEKRLTRAVGFDISVGVDQRLTPVQLLEPVNLNGALIKRASLGSFGIAMKEGFWPLYENQIVEIIRSNEIMPHVNRVVSKGEKLIDDTVLTPKCPVCGSEGEPDGEHYFCVNPDCPNIEHSKLLRFSANFYPDKLGHGIMGKVFRHFNITEIIDLYSVDIDEVEHATIPGIKDAHKARVLAFFAKIHGKVDAKVMYNVYLRSCGKTFSRAIAESGFVWKDLIDGDMEKIEALKSIRGLHKAIPEQMKRSVELFKKLSEKIDIFDEVITQTVGTYCITGTRFSDSQVKALAANGWKEDTSVKKTTTYLILADLDFQSTKTKKAVQYGVKVIAIEDFIDLYLA